MNIDQIILESYENYYFEEKVAEYHRHGIVKNPIYLSQGTTHIPVILKHALEDAGINDFAIFPQHRCHSCYLTFSENKTNAMELLSKELCGRSDGCGKGMTGSASLHIPEVVYGHDGHLGTNAPIACGYAQATGKTTICEIGDSACEEDYVLASLGYAATHDLPILFLVVNNGLSILTDIPTRRSWEIWKVATGFGLGTCRVNDELDGSWDALYLILKSWLKTKQPCLVETEVCRHRWHAGSGTDGPPKWNSMDRQLTYLLEKDIGNTPVKALSSIVTMLSVKDNIDNIWGKLDG